MDVFAFRDELITKYERFSRSFVNICAEDISRKVDAVSFPRMRMETEKISLRPLATNSGNPCPAVTPSSRKRLQHQVQMTGFHTMPKIQRRK